MAKRNTRKTTKKQAARKKSAPARRKPAAKRKAAPKTASRKTATKKVARKAARKTTRKAARKTTRKPAKPRAIAKVKKTSKPTGPKTAGKPTSRTRARAAAPEQTVSAAPLEAPVKRRNPLRKRDFDLFRELLLAKRSQLVGDVSTLQKQALSENRQDAAGDLSSMPIHMADLGTDNYEKEFTLGLIESERTLLREIDQALGRIDDGTYGICEATGKPIGKARLKAQPWVRFCYEYMLAQEEGQRSSGL